MQVITKCLAGIGQLPPAIGINFDDVALLKRTSVVMEVT